MLLKTTAHVPLTPGQTTQPAWTFGTADKCCSPPPPGPDAATPARGSRRRRLWELDAHAHCPVVGVCLPMAVLRRLSHGLEGAAQAEDDFDLHILAVGHCKRRSKLAEAIQAELDRRYRAALRACAQVKTTAALQDWWGAQAGTHDLPGALWAVLSHPRCDDELEDRVLGQVHMLQHQVGMATRVELARFEALMNENAVLGRSLADAQQRLQRHQQQTMSHGRVVEGLQAELVKLRGQRLAADSERLAVAEDLATLRASVPALATREALVQRCAQQDERIEHLQRSLAQARQQLAERRAPPVAVAEVPPPAVVAEPAAGAEPHTLSNRAVLCVGGRTGSVPIYRRLIEDCGGRFLHHDGGESEHVRRLDATLAAADLVICQTGCLSHEAYWRVKDHCKRTGKRCVFVDTPSAAHLQRALNDVGSVNID